MNFEDKLFAGALVAISVLIALVAISNKRDRDAFMVACQKDRKEYECVAMWRAGDSHTTVMPIVMPVR
jgi:hypothetical protein